MKWIKTIEDLTSHLFTRKERKATKLAGNGVEKPKEIYETVCQEIADALNTLGFTYSKSNHQLILSSANKKYELRIRFSSSRYNIAGSYVEFSAAFFIISKDLKQFSVTHPLLDYTYNTLVISDFGTLLDPQKGNTLWNIQTEADRQLAIEAVVCATRERLISFFNQLQNSKFVIQRVTENKLQLENAIVTVQYLLMHNRKDLAERYIAMLLTGQEMILQSFLEKRKLFAIDGLPSEYIQGLGYGYDIALMEKIYDLKIDTNALKVER